MVTLEASGIPTVTIVERDFVQDYTTTARGVGLPELPLARAQAPYTGLSKEAVRQDVDQLIEQIIAGLTTPIHAGTDLILEPISTQAGYEAPWGVVEQGPVDEEVIRFTGKDYAAAYDKFQEAFLTWGWGDGLPLIPPTKERVEAMLKGTSHAPGAVVTERFPPGDGKATIKSIAINAVMAGAKPEYLPVILAATESMATDPHFLITAQSTSPHAPFFVVNGPIIKELGFNYLAGTLGPGSQSRVNIAVGRATRLIMMNIGGAYVGVKDMDTIGAATKFNLVAAENEDDLAELGWKPFHIDKGFSPDTSTITQFRIGDHNEIFGMATANPEGLLASAAHDMGCIACGMGVFAMFGGTRGTGGREGSTGRASVLVLLSGDDARLMHRGGWTTKEAIRTYLAEHVCLDRETYMKYFPKGKAAIARKYPEGNICGIVAPENITLLRVGYNPGKSAFYRGGRPDIVSIDTWR